MDRMKELKKSEVIAVKVDDLGLLGSIYPPEVPDGVVQLVEDRQGCRRTERERVCEGMVLVKAAPQEVRIGIDGLRTEDEKALSVEVKLLLDFAKDELDAESFFQLLSERQTLSREDVSRLLKPLIRGYLKDVFSSMSIDDCFKSEGEEAARRGVLKAFEEVRFRYGIALERLIRVSFKSTDYERMVSARRIAEQKAAQLEVLKKRGIDEKKAEEAVLQIRTGGFTHLERLFIASDRKVFIYDSEALTTTSTKPTTELKASAPVRSVRIVKTPDGERLALGLLDTVLLLDMESFEESGRYTYDADTTHGFNSTTVSGEHLYGSHSQFGLLRWGLESGKVERLWRRGSRSVISSEDGEVFFASADDLLNGTVPPKRLYEAGAEINSVTPIGELLALATTTGEVVLFDRRTGTSTKHTVGAKIYSTAPAELPNGDALLLGTKSSGLHALLLASGKTILFEAKEPVRWVAGASDIVVGVSYSLSSLLVWDADSPSQARRIPLPAEAYDIVAVKVPADA